MLPFSAATGEGVREVLEAMETALRENPVAPAPRAEPLPPRGRARVAAADAASDDAEPWGEYVREPHDGLDDEA